MASGKEIRKGKLKRMEKQGGGEGEETYRYTA